MFQLLAVHEDRNGIKGISFLVGVAGQLRNILFADFGDVIADAVALFHGLDGSDESFCGLLVRGIFVSETGGDGQDMEFRVNDGAVGFQHEGQKNGIGKAMSLFGGAKNAGIILGAKVPVVLVSRADSAESKLASIALGAVTAGKV